MLRTGLGSSAYITDVEGEVTQHIEYFPFGETFLEEHSNTDRTPYLFNAKELDEETGLYYYGARYYDARTSVWQSADPLALYDPVKEVEHYLDGQHNKGVYNSFNGAAYSYCYQNPVRLVDPNGKQVWAESILGFIAADVAVPEPTDAAWPKWVAYGVAATVATTAIYMTKENARVEPKAVPIPKVETIPREKKGDFASVRFQLQKGREHLSSNTQINSKETGVLKSQGYAALALIHGDMLTKNPELAKSKEFISAIIKTSEKINSIQGGIAPVPYQTDIQETFIYKNKEYRIDVEVQRGVNFKQ